MMLSTHFDTLTALGDGHPYSNFEHFPGILSSQWTRENLLMMNAIFFSSEISPSIDLRIIPIE